MRNSIFHLILGFTIASPVISAEKSDLFRDKVAPIFQRHCLKCHNSVDREGNFSIHSKKSILAGGENGPALIPGNSKESLLLEYISGEDPEMPKEGTPLSKQEISTIEKWISEGAHWTSGYLLAAKDLPDTEWWSLRELKKPALPDLSEREMQWIRNPVDIFIQSKLLEKKLSPSPEADRRTLIRRLFFDLIGLPPSPEEVEQFIQNQDSQAYEKLIDRLLRSPHYGERWARHWLDVVHYGDTHGYDKDKTRPNSWPYRDYVISSLNQDKSYSRFVSEQLAGDILFPKHPDGIVATGFIAAGPWDYVGHVELREGTVDKKITRNLDRDDIVMNTMSTFVSMTAHCARCHNHKFDPITQEDYYGLQAVFAGVERAERPYVADKKLESRRRELLLQQKTIKEKREQLNIKISTIASANANIREIDSEFKRINSEIAKLPPPEKGSPSNGYHSAISSKQNVTKWVQVELKESTHIRNIRLVPARPTDFPDTPGFGFPVRFKIEVSNSSDFKNDVRVLADYTSSNYQNPGDESLLIPARNIEARFVRLTATKLWKRTGDYVLALSELQVEASDQSLAAIRRVTALDSIESGRWAKKHLIDNYSSRGPLLPGNVQLANQEKLREELKKKLETLTGRRASLIEQLLDEKTKKTRQKLSQNWNLLSARIAKLPPQPVVYAAAQQFKRQGNFTPPPNGKPRQIHLLSRGSVEAPRDLVGPGAISCIPNLSARFDISEDQDEGQRRVALARWITSSRNPLTWRSIVNRLWHYHFGRGLVSTPSDFGRMGAKPSHPELLDYLAVEFRDGRQSLKDLHRLIVTSATYRQSSRTDELKAKIDGNNQYLWRQNRQRLEAETLRDTVLTVSGKLDLKMYGPGYYLFGFKDDHSPHYLYDQFDVDDPKSLRRTIYRFIVRSAPDPLMETLDCADPSQNVPVRNKTITALQALAMLNNPLMVRQAEHFANRIVSKTEVKSLQVDWIYRIALSRIPSERERMLVLEYIEKHGLASACRLIMNTNEFHFID